MSNPNRPPSPPSNRPPPPPADATHEASAPSSQGNLSISREDLQKMMEAVSERAALALGVALKGSGIGQARTLSVPNAVANEGPSGSCSECQQQLKACKGEHAQMVVFPKNPRFARWFPGLQLNGINYRSNHAGHRITVPALNDFAYRLNQFEAEEEANTMGRVTQHNSGFIGPSAAHYGGMRPIGESFQDRHIIR
jgi:hypothetical protein